MGTINVLSKEKADEIARFGFKYKEYKIDVKQVVYAFIDTPEVRSAITSRCKNNEFFTRDVVYF